MAQHLPAQRLSDRQASQHSALALLAATSLTPQWRPGAHGGGQSLNTFPGTPTDPTNPLDSLTQSLFPFASTSQVVAPKPPLDILRQMHLPIAPAPPHLQTSTRPTRSTEERRQRRLLRNREAAKQCRAKKKVFVQELEDKLRTEEQDNAELDEENQLLRAENERLKERLRKCGCSVGEGLNLDPCPERPRRKRDVTKPDDSEESEQTDRDSNEYLVGEGRNITRGTENDSMGLHQIFSPMEALLAAVASEQAIS
ncbi:hypothetical protein HK097_009417 [Rhizophlyctis rosea]|uniref:BZIP domain-containing protein n=1 Tax=Rhizophlyctis rosea TaxID=64517 RepID=A0AAD5X893_9FUNG|nr:hypothetical protein HK097_009417 [Rhizophlyctis rosea]